MRRTSKDSHQWVLRQEVLRFALRIFLTLQNVLMAILHELFVTPQGGTFLPGFWQDYVLRMFMPAVW